MSGRQHGVVTLEQLRALGLGDGAIYARVRRGRLHRIQRGVYAVGHPTISVRGRQLAAVLSCGPSAVLSHRSAGELWGLTRGGGGSIHVTAPRARHGCEGLVVHRSRRLAADECAVVEAIPVTSVARTLVDLAGVLDAGRLAAAVNEAEVRRLFDLVAVDRALSRAAGAAGARALGQILAAHRSEPFTRSEAERRFLELCRSNGLPAPRVNQNVAGYEVDFLWGEQRVVAEVDGAAFHATRHAFHADRRRDRALTAHGLRVIRLTWADICDQPAGLVADLRAILGLARSAC